MVRALAGNVYSLLLQDVVCTSNNNNAVLSSCDLQPSKGSGCSCSEETPGHNRSPTIPKSRSNPPTTSLPCSCFWTIFMNSFTLLRGRQWRQGYTPALLLAGAPGDKSPYPWQPPETSWTQSHDGETSPGQSYDGSTPHLLTFSATHSTLPGCHQCTHTGKNGYVVCEVENQVRESPDITGNTGRINRQEVTR